ncbi:MAG: hypothetical protein GF329_05960 [Candidatus Lokiarchaeota archaeon]|nr:hypothetical protein [Candidatus Lokiarchaeota archaeon]
MKKTNFHKKRKFYGLILIAMLFFLLGSNNSLIHLKSAQENNLENIYNLDTDLTIEEAMSSPLVDVVINGTVWGFWGQCIDVYLEQLTTEDVTITISAGVVLSPADSGVQNMIVAKTEVVYLTFSGDSEIITLYAFCGESSDDAPDEDDTFTVSSISYGPSTCVGKILAYFETNDTYIDTQSGQFAIWACIDGVASVRPLVSFLPGTEEEVNLILEESGTGLSLDRPSIPGFSLFPTIITLFSALGLILILYKKKNF